VCAVPVVELMSPHRLSRQKISFCLPAASSNYGIRDLLDCSARDLNIHISEPHQFPCRKSPSPDLSYERIDISFPVLHLLMQIHKSSAFGKTGHSILESVPDR